MHASIQSASAYMVPTILQVSDDNISQVEGILRRSSSRKRIHPASSGGHHLPMEEGPTGLSPKSIATSAGRASSSILCISIPHACLALYIAAFLCRNRLCTKTKCGRTLPSLQAFSPQAKHPDCCHNAPCYDASSCKESIMVRTAVFQSDCCVLPGLGSKISKSWAAAGVQVLRSPSDQPFELEVVSRGRHAASQQVCLRRPLLVKV